MVEGRIRPRALARTQHWSGYTPGGQRLLVEQDQAIWVVTCGDAEPVRHHFLDVALPEAIRSDVACDWYGIDRGRYTRVVANSILDS